MCNILQTNIFAADFLPSGAKYEPQTEI